LVVMMTIGGSSALTVPSSGIVAVRDRQRLQHRPADQVLFREQIALQASAIHHALGLGEPDVQHLHRIIPFVDGRRDIEAFIALQPDQTTTQRLCQNLGDFGFAHPGVAFEEQRPLQLQGEEQDRRKRATGKIIMRFQHGDRLIDRRGQRSWNRLCHEHSGASQRNGGSPKYYRLW